MSFEPRVLWSPDICLSKLFEPIYYLLFSSKATPKHTIQYMLSSHASFRSAAGHIVQPVGGAHHEVPQVDPSKRNSVTYLF